ncbi:ATP-binding protein [Microbulbifer bruguierae]|uniref:ATP-binding protein n=1 Tax=Microbulbifer bruguierae TaxID=3029061 RepID=A0ABY8NFL9_9GAMM|nr:ATP-binding protein [Microbulbifer bruguierae]WGL16532.1 ATP-binding protein [Microbulbifer bruguierae]
MELVFKQPHVSITQFNPIELSDFTVITGVNGSGKSHLLSAIEQKKCVIQGLENATVVHFNYENFKLENEAAFNAQQIKQETTAAWTFYQQKVKPHTPNWKKQIDQNAYPLLKEECKNENKGLWELGVTTLKNYRDSIRGLFGSNQMKGNAQAQGILSVVKKLPYSADEIKEEDFNSIYKPYMFKNDFLPMQLGKVIWDYYVKYQQNRFYHYENSENGKNYPVLSEKEFIEKHGRKPWDVINEIMEEFDTLEYRVSSPEGSDYFSQYQLKLEHTRTPGLQLDFANLSSGERVLMALVASIYKSTSDNHFPDILLLDEVDASLHPSMMKNMLGVIQNIFLENGIKVLLVSHSPSTIALSPEESIFVMNKSGENRIEKRSKKEALSILTEGFATLNDIEPTLSVNYNLSKTDLPILFTEGITDKIMIEVAWAKLYPEIDMPFFVQDCFDASFLANLFRRGHDGQDGIFVNYNERPLIALFDFDAEGFNSWNGLSQLSKIVETDPRKCLRKCHAELNAYAILLPVPTQEKIEKQVIKSGIETFKDKSNLSIELLFYGDPSLSQYFSIEIIQGGGEIVVFKGKKRDFSDKVRSLGPDSFKAFVPLFDQIQNIVNAHNKSSQGTQQSCAPA